MNLSLALYSQNSANIFRSFGITTVEELSRMTVLDVYELNEYFHSMEILSSIRKQGMAESLQKRTTMSFLPVETVISIERFIRKIGAAYILNLFEKYKQVLPFGMKYQLFLQSLKANLFGRKYSFSSKYDIVSYSPTAAHPTSILIGLMRELRRPITKTEAKDCLGCSTTTLLNYLKEEPESIVLLSNGHLVSPSSFEFSPEALRTIQDFMDVRDEFNPAEVEMALKWKANEILSINELKSPADIKLFIDECLTRLQASGWQYDAEDDCYYYEEAEQDGKD